LSESEKRGETYSTFIKDQLDAEYDRRASLDARGIAVITTSGVLATLVIGAASFSLGKDYVPSTLGRGLVVAGLILFCGAALFGLIASALRSYDVAKRARLEDMTSNAHWADSEEEARRNTAASNTATIKSLREGNDQKATRLVIGLSLQLLAVASLVAAVVAEFLAVT
jgi:hypothetical protein